MLKYLSAQALIRTPKHRHNQALHTDTLQRRRSFLTLAFPGAGELVVSLLHLEEGNHKVVCADKAHSGQFIRYTDCNSSLVRSRLMIVRLQEGYLKTKFGTFLEVLYYDGQKESVALVMGDISNSENVLCRIHSSCLSAHVFNSIECDCREQMEMAQFIIEQEGRGIIIWLEQEGEIMVI